MKKAFTLVELMGVIVIIGILAVIVVTVVSGNIKESRNESCLVQENNIIEGAKTYFIDYPDKLPDANHTSSVSIKILKDNGYIDSELVNPMTEEEYNDNSAVIVSSSNGTSYTYSVSYYNEDGCE